jgi:hypothetical protein
VGLGVGGGGSDLQAAVGERAEAAQRLDPAQPDDVVRLGEAPGHQQHHGSAAGHQVRVVAVALQQPDRLLDGVRLVVVEGPHRGHALRAAARTASTI